LYVVNQRPIIGIADITAAAAAAVAAAAASDGRTVLVGTGVNPAGDAGDTSPQYFGWGDVNRNIPANIIMYFWILQTNIGCPLFAKPQAVFIRL